MIFDWEWFKTRKLQEPKPLWEYSEEPYYNKEHRETMAIIEDIMVKLDEIKALVEEMKEDENAK